MSPPSSSFKKKIRRKKPTLVRAKRVVNAHEHSYLKTALSQSRISNMSYKKRIQTLLENNKGLAQALETAEINRQQQEQVILGLQKQLTHMNPTVIKRNLKKMGMLIQQVVNLMADTLDYVMQIDDDDDKEEDVTEAQLPLLPETSVSNSSCSVPDHTPVKSSATCLQRRSLHNDLREKFGICDLTVINEDTLRLQEMTLPPILFTDGEDNINSSRNSKRNSSRHKSSRKGRSTVSLSGRGSSLETRNSSSRNGAEAENRHPGFEAFQDLNHLKDSSVRVSGQHDVLKTPSAETVRCNASPSSEAETPKTPVLSPLIYSKTKQVAKSNIPRLVSNNLKKSVTDEMCGTPFPDPVQRRETFVVLSSPLRRDVISVLQRSPDKFVTVSEATSSNRNTVTGQSSHATEGARKGQNTAQAICPSKVMVQHVPDSCDNLQKTSCVPSHMEDKTVNLNEDMELTCPVGNFLVPPENHIRKIEKLVEPPVVKETEQQQCDDQTTDLTEIYYSQAFCDVLFQTAKSGPQSKAETAKIPMVSLVNEVSDSAESRPQSQKGTSEISVVNLLLDSVTDEASDVTEIYNVKAYCNTPSHPKDQTDKKLPPAGSGKSPANCSGQQSKQTDGSVVSKGKSQTTMLDSALCPKDHDDVVETNRENPVSGSVQSDPCAADTVTYVLKESELKHLSDGVVTRTTKSKGNDTSVPKTVSSPLDSDARLQSTDRRGTFVVPRKGEDHCVDSQAGPSCISRLGKRKSRIKPSDTLKNSQPEYELGSEPKSQSPSKKSSPYRFPEKDHTSRSRGKTGKKVSKSSKKSSSDPESFTLGRKKFHLSQFSAGKSHSKEGSTKEEPKFKFFSKKSYYVKDTVKKKTDKPSETDAAKQMDVYDVTAFHDDQVVEKPLSNTAGDITSAVSKRKESSRSQKNTRSQNDAEVLDKTKAAASSKQMKRKSVSKENTVSKKAKYEDQNKNEGIVTNSTGDISEEKDQSCHQPNLRSRHKRKSVSFRMPSDEDIHLFDNTETICLPSKTHMEAQGDEERGHETQIENASRSPAVPEHTDQGSSEYNQCRKSFVVLEDIFSQSNKACNLGKQNDGIEHSAGTSSGSSSDIASFHVKDSPAKSKSLKSDNKNERGVADSDVISKKQISCGSSDPSSDKEKAKGSSKASTTHGEPLEVHGKVHQSPEEATGPHQARKSTRKTMSVASNKENVLKDKSTSDKLPKELAFNGGGDNSEADVACGSTENKTSSAKEKEAKTTKNVDSKGDKGERSIADANPPSVKEAVCEPSEPSSDKEKLQRSLKTGAAHKGIMDVHKSNKAPLNSKKAKIPHQARKSSRKGDDVPIESKKENFPDLSRSSSIGGILQDSMAGLGSFRESSGRSRRKTCVVSYKEPRLGTKMRRGDEFFSKN